MNQLAIAHRTGPAEPRRDISLVLLSVNRELRLCQVMFSNSDQDERNVQFEFICGFAGTFWAHICSGDPVERFLTEQLQSVKSLALKTGCK